MSHSRKKAKNKRDHFLSRLMERFAITIGEEELRSLKDDIYNYKCKPFHFSENRRFTFHKYKINNQDIIILYDWLYFTPVTVYRPSWFGRDEDGKIVYKKRNKVAKSKDRRKRERYNAFRDKTMVGGKL